MNLPKNEIPSPERIAATLLRDPSPATPTLPERWNAQVLLTPFGGIPAGPLGHSDQLVIGNISYDGSRADTLLMRANLYLLESCTYYDFLFVTSNNATSWYWLVSDPGQPDSFPRASFGPFSSPAKVLSPKGLQADDFAYVGDWRIVGRLCSNFVTSTPESTSTWYSIDRESDELWRVMNTNPKNELSVALFGAYYLTNICTSTRHLPRDLCELSLWCRGNSTDVKSPSPLLDLGDFLEAFSNPPPGTQQVCTIEDIQAQVPGVTFPAEGEISPPKWADQVDISCYMIGTDPYPYYSRVWYDWTARCQLTVLVKKGAADEYDARLDELLPKGKTGPSVQYTWDGAAWVPVCRNPQGGFEAMSRPDFIKAANGRCRAIIKNRPAFSDKTIAIWSVTLGDNAQWSDFWCWFDGESRGILFSLAPAPSLTMIDYQTFERNVPILSSLFIEPVKIPICAPGIDSFRSSFPRCQPIR